MFAPFVFYFFGLQIYSVVVVANSPFYKPEFKVDPRLLVYEIDEYGDPVFSPFDKLLPIRDKFEIAKERFNVTVFDYGDEYMMRRQKMFQSGRFDPQDPKLKARRDEGRARLQQLRNQQLGKEPLQSTHQ